MKTSTIKRNVINALFFLFWIFVWHLCSVLLKQEMLLASPVSVFLKLGALIREQNFWRGICFSFFNVTGGFFLALFFGVFLAAASGNARLIEQALAPLFGVIKATPVASYAVLCLLFLPSKNLSVFISFFAVLPIIYNNVLTGIKMTDSKLLEMADVFKVSARKKLLYIYFSEVLPYFVSACSVSLGICWKAGVAAEVIGLPRHSVGENLYAAKINLDSESLFAWTFVIIVVSILFEKIFLKGIQKAARFVERI